MDFGAYSLGTILLTLGFLAVVAFAGFPPIRVAARRARSRRERLGAWPRRRQAPLKPREGRITDEEFRRAHDSMLARRPNAEEIARYRIRK